MIPGRVPNPVERPWLTVAELAQITREGEKAIRAAIAAGTLPSLRVGRYVRIPTAKLRQQLGIDPQLHDLDDVAREFGVELDDDDDA